MNGPNLRMILGHIIYGIHSNIPLCCILDFIWDCEFKGKSAGDVRRKEYGEVAIDYVPCRSCADNISLGRQQQIRVHRCTHNCLPILSLLEELSFPLIKEGLR